MPVTILAQPITVDLVINYDSRRRVDFVCVLEYPLRDTEVDSECLDTIIELMIAAGPQKCADGYERLWGHCTRILKP